MGYKHSKQRCTCTPWDKILHPKTNVKSDRLFFCSCTHRASLGGVHVSCALGLQNPGGLEKQVLDISLFADWGYIHCSAVARPSMQLVSSCNKWAVWPLAVVIHRDGTSVWFLFRLRIGLENLRWALKGEGNGTRKLKCQHHPVLCLFFSGICLHRNNWRNIRGKLRCIINAYYKWLDIIGVWEGESTALMFFCYQNQVWLHKTHRCFSYNM